jgi:hypothetical protein
VSSAELLSEMKEFKCINCKTCFLDPFIKESLLKNFFSEVKYSHRGGWQKIVDITRKGKFSHSYKSSLKKITGVSRFLRGIEEYYEVGCPFMGFLPLFGNEGDLEQTLVSFYNNQEQHFSENSFGNLMPRSFSKWLNRVQKLRLNLKFTKTKHLDFIKEIVPKKSAVLITNSPLMWGSNCIGDQGLCHLVAKRNLLVDEMTMDVYESKQKKENRPNTIISFMNTLDHQVNPQELFNLALSKSKYVLVEIHAGGAIEKQHAFILDETLLNHDRLITVFDSEGNENTSQDVLDSILKKSTSSDLLMVFEGNA